MGCYNRPVTMKEALMQIRLHRGLFLLNLFYLKTYDNAHLKTSIQLHIYYEAKKNIYFYLVLKRLKERFLSVKILPNMQNLHHLKLKYTYQILFYKNQK